VATSVEVTDAQNRLARARDNHIAALFLLNRARLDLWQAMGTTRQMVD
jgi:outer membrane protein TolC